jgi:hypothetical protein
MPSELLTRPPADASREAITLTNVQPREVGRVLDIRLPPWR